jgi:hypothetical protein
LYLNKQGSVDNLRIASAARSINLRREEVDFLYQDAVREKRKKLTKMAEIIISKCESKSDEKLRKILEKNKIPEEIIIKFIKPVESKKGIKNFLGF